MSFSPTNTDNNFIGFTMYASKDLATWKNEGVILPSNQAGKGMYSYFQRLLEGLARDLNFSLDVPWRELPEEVQQSILRGNDFEVVVQWRNRYGRTMKYSTGFEGVMPYIERKYREAESDWSQQRYGEYLREIPLRRLGTTQEIGDVVAFLCSRQASYVSGTVIFVDGAASRSL